MSIVSFQRRFNHWRCPECGITEPQVVFREQTNREIADQHDKEVHGGRHISHFGWVKKDAGLAVVVAEQDEYCLLQVPMQYRGGLKPITPSFEYWMIPNYDVFESRKFRAMSEKVSRSNLEHQRKVNILYLYAVGSIHEVTIEGIIAGANNV